jgi:hypothetical protein
MKAENDYSTAVDLVIVRQRQMMQPENACSTELQLIDADDDCSSLGCWTKHFWNDDNMVMALTLSRSSRNSTAVPKTWVHLTVYTIHVVFLLRSKLG